MECWYDQARAKTEAILQAIVNHDFVVDLMAGSLTRDIFGFYVNQDALYLSEYKKALVAVGAKCYEGKEAQFFFEAATGIIEVEDSLHETFAQEKYYNPEPSPTCELYNSYLARIVHNSSVEVGLAALLPCFSIYKEVGDYILENQTNAKNNTFQAWIDTYASAEFGKAVERAIAITNKYAQTASPENLKKMEEVFIKTSKLEWMFWDSAYNMEAWEIVPKRGRTKITG